MGTCAGPSSTTSSWLQWRCNGAVASHFVPAMTLGGMLIFKLQLLFGRYGITPPPVYLKDPLKLRKDATVWEHIVSVHSWTRDAENCCPCNVSSKTWGKISHFSTIRQNGTGDSMEMCCQAWDKTITYTILSSDLGMRTYESCRLAPRANRTTPFV